MNKPLTQIKSHTAEIEKTKKEIQLLILNLPDNPEIKRINQKCFTVSSSQLFGKSNPQGRMDVFFHDFKAQYRLIAKVLEASRPENIISNLQKIGDDESIYKDGSHYRFNPQVVEHIRELINTLT